MFYNLSLNLDNIILYNIDYLNKNNIKKAQLALLPNVRNTVYFPSGIRNKITLRVNK